MAASKIRQALRGTLLSAMAAAAALIVTPFRNAEANPPAATQTASHFQTYTVYGQGNGGSNLAVRLIPDSGATGGMRPQVLKNGQVMTTGDGSPAWGLVEGKQFLGPNNLIMEMLHKPGAPNTIGFRPAVGPDTQKLLNLGSRQGEANTFGGRFPNGVVAMSPIVSNGDFGLGGGTPLQHAGAFHRAVINPTEQGLNYLGRTLGDEGGKPFQPSHFKLNREGYDVMPTGPGALRVGNEGHHGYDIKNNGGVLTVENDKFIGAFVKGKFHVADKTAVNITASAEAIAFAQTASRIVIATGRHFAAGINVFSNYYPPESIIIENYQSQFIPAVEKQKIEIIEIKKTHGIRKAVANCWNDCCEALVRQQKITNQLLATIFGNKVGKTPAEVLKGAEDAIDGKSAAPLPPPVSTSQANPLTIDLGNTTLASLGGAPQIIMPNLSDVTLASVEPQRVQLASAEQPAVRDSVMPLPRQVVVEVGKNSWLSHFSFVSSANAAELSQSDRGLSFGDDRTPLAPPKDRREDWALLGAALGFLRTRKEGTTSDLVLGKDRGLDEGIRSGSYATCVPLSAQPTSLTIVGINAQSTAQIVQPGVVEIAAPVQAQAIVASEGHMATPYNRNTHQVLDRFFQGGELGAALAKGIVMDTALINGGSDKQAKMQMRLSGNTLHVYGSFRGKQDSVLTITRSENGTYQIQAARFTSEGKMTEPKSTMVKAGHVSKGANHLVQVLVNATSRGLQKAANDEGSFKVVKFRTPKQIMPVLAA